MLEIIQLGKNVAGQERDGHWVSPKDNPENNGKYGPFTFRDGKVQLDMDFVKQLEASKDDNVLACRIFMLMNDVLHEGAHGIAEDKGPPYSTGDGTEKDIGDDFEINAFGGILSERGDGIIHIMGK
jgi:hypothetical protein